MLEYKDFKLSHNICGELHKLKKRSTTSGKKKKYVFTTLFSHFTKCCFDK